MIFGEIFYAGFLSITLIIYWLVPANLRISIIAISGMIFYGYYAGIWLVLLAFITGCSWLFLFHLFPIQTEKVTFIEPKAAPQRFWFLAIILLFVFILGYFKYGNFIQGIFTNQPKEITVVPLAISFFTFEFIHLAAERAKAKLNYISYSAYFAFIFFFPTMIAGPIKRYNQFDSQLHESKLTATDFLEGLFRILIGMVKKIVIADNLNTLIQEIGSPEKTNNLFLLSGTVFIYGFRIYLDFSGYSDIAVGSARLFGIRVPENFNYPYLRTNITEFWRHWHISLYTWLVDYVYIPLGGSRVAVSRNLLNILITMFVSGLWHGAAWNFILWGVWHGILLVIHKLFVDRIKPLIKNDITQSYFYLGCSYILTMSAVWFGWSLFMWKIPEVIHYYNLLWKAIA